MGLYCYALSGKINTHTHTLELSTTCISKMLPFAFSIKSKCLCTPYIYHYSHVYDSDFYTPANADSIRYHNSNPILQRSAGERDCLEQYCARPACCHTHVHARLLLVSQEHPLTKRDNDIIVNSKKNTKMFDVYFL